MTAYALFDNLSVEDEAGLAEYRSRVKAVVERYGGRYVVVDPPVGLVVSFLPQFSTTLHVGGVPYYRAGPVYYVWNPRARGYVVTDRPYRRW